MQGLVLFDRGLEVEKRTFGEIVNSHRAVSGLEISVGKNVVENTFFMDGKFSGGQQVADKSDYIFSVSVFQLDFGLDIYSGDVVLSEQVEQFFPVPVFLFTVSFSQDLVVGRVFQTFVNSIVYVIVRRFPVCRQ